MQYYGRHMDNDAGPSNSSRADESTQRHLILTFLVITRMFEAPRELVWRAWTEPERLMRWWGAKVADYLFRMAKERGIMAILSRICDMTRAEAVSPAHR